MEWWKIVVLILSLAMMLIGLAGTLLPIIPGAPLIFVVVLVYGVIDGFTAVTGGTIAVMAILAGAALLCDYLSTVIGVKRMGGSNYGVAGAFVGMIAGFFLGMGLPGLIIGPIVGAVLFESLLGPQTNNALKAGLGSFLGFLLGGVIRFALGAAMIGIFVWQVLIKSPAAN